MKTPICEFVRSYIAHDACRLHMPGHKGVSLLGFEAPDITEIDGADDLFAPKGIIRESEKNASALFGAHTLYSTEGSSLSIRTMLCLVAKLAAERGEKPLILAGRNAHRSFLSAAMLLDLEVEWLAPVGESYLECRLDPALLEQRLSSDEQPRPIAVCHAHGVLLLVDNAHGAYLRFLPVSRHPIDLGADLCCDSAHKTLPVLTGGAYLHISHTVPDLFLREAKSTMALFASSSPSYLILQSLDMANAYLAGGYADRLAAYAARLDAFRAELSAMGFSLCGDEPLKLTLLPKSYGYEGGELAAILEEEGLVCEFSDPDHLVMMFTPELGEQVFDRLRAALSRVPRREALTEKPPQLSLPRRALSPREAMLTPSELLPIGECEGRIYVGGTVACPPAVPIVAAGEVIDGAALTALAYYGVRECPVAKK